MQQQCKFRSTGLLAAYELWYTVHSKPSVYLVIENCKVLTWCPGGEDDDVHWLLAARQVDDQRGQPPVEARPHAQCDVEGDLLIGMARHLGPQVVQGPAVELERGPAELVEFPVVVGPHVPDCPLAAEEAY